MKARINSWFTKTAQDLVKARNNFQILLSRALCNIFHHLNG
jgi:hypothetical protein